MRPMNLSSFVFIEISGVSFQLDMAWMHFQLSYRTVVAQIYHRLFNQFFYQIDRAKRYLGALNKYKLEILLKFDFLAYIIKMLTNI